MDDEPEKSIEYICKLFREGYTPIMGSVKFRRFIDDLTPIDMGAIDPPAQLEDMQEEWGSIGKIHVNTSDGRTVDMVEELNQSSGIIPSQALIADLTHQTSAMLVYEYLMINEMYDHIPKSKYNIVRKILEESKQEIESKIIRDMLFSTGSKYEPDGELPLILDRSGRQLTHQEIKELWEKHT